MAAIDPAPRPPLSAVNLEACAPPLRVFSARARVRSQRSLLLPFLADVRPSVDRTDSSTHDCAARARRPASRSRLPAAATLVSSTNSYALKLDSPRLVWHPTAETPFSPCDGSCYNTPNHPNSSRGGLRRLCAAVKRSASDTYAPSATHSLRQTRNAAPIDPGLVPHSSTGRAQEPRQEQRELRQALRRVEGKLTAKNTRRRRNTGRLTRRVSVTKKTRNAALAETDVRRTYTCHGADF